jgi:hypothetical protein
MLFSVAEKGNFKVVTLKGKRGKEREKTLEEKSSFL